MSKILVTGAAGFIGYHLAAHLASRGREVILVDNFTRGAEDRDFSELLQQQNISFLKMDLSDQASIDQLPDGVTQVYHLAAINGTSNFYKIPDQVLRINIQTTLNLLEWAKSQKNIKMVYTSSSEAYAGTVQQNPSLVPTKEDVPLCIDDVTNVRWSYGASKLLGECAMFAYGSRYGFEFSVVRYHNIYGPRMGYEHVIPQFIQRAFEGESPLKVYGTENTRAFCYITDAIRATLLVMESEESSGQIYHIGNDAEEIEISELAKKVLASMGQKPEILAMGAPAGSVNRRCPDISKMKRLGYVPEVNLEMGLKPMIEWYLKAFGRGNGSAKLHG